MSRSPREYLRHILDEMAYLTDRSQSLGKVEFLQDATLTRAFVRSLEIIGEASKNVPADFRQKHSQVDWRGMAAMRDRLIHGYFGVDYEIVWTSSSTKCQRSCRGSSKSWRSKVHRKVKAAVQCGLIRGSCAYCHSCSICAGSQIRHHETQQEVNP